MPALATSIRRTSAPTRGATRVPLISRLALLQFAPMTHQDAPQQDKTGSAFERSIFDTLKLAARVTAYDPRFAARALRLLRRQFKAARIRRRHAGQGIHVPPFSIFSITSACNLNCVGCYANILHRAARPELADDRIARLFGEARDLGVSIMLLAGGEPMMRDRLLDLTATAPEILFLLFTNATLIDDAAVEQLRSQPHVIPVLSLEGDESQTDARRGAGAHAQVLKAMRKLRHRRVFFGTSTTLTRENYDTATSQEHLDDLVRRGCRLFYYINYIPVKPGTEDLQLPGSRVQAFERLLAEYRKSMPCLFIAFPHDEIALGGCLAAGRGFIHINAYGDVEPCPFSPFSDRNLMEVSLRDAIQSPLLRRIRQSGVHLDETDGQCALWSRREWVAGLCAEETTTERASEADAIHAG